MKDIYTDCPIVENEKYKIRLIAKEDAEDLLKVYSDKKAVSLCNKDNCGGDDFYFTTEKMMKDVICAWLHCYSIKDFVRMSIIDKVSNEAIGTMEMFHREAEDYYTNCCLLRLDLRSDFERAEEIDSILSLIIPKVFAWFVCDKVATKAISQAVERVKALNILGFTKKNEKFIGEDGTEYKGYFVLKR